jgi:hypothetical protein
MKDTKPTTINYLKAAQTDEMTKQRWTRPHCYYHIVWAVVTCVVTHLSLKCCGQLVKNHWLKVARNFELGGHILEFASARNRGNYETSYPNRITWRVSPHSAILGIPGTECKRTHHQWTITQAS